MGASIPILSTYLADSTAKTDGRQRRTPALQKNAPLFPPKNIDLGLRAFFDVGPDFTNNMGEKLSMAKAKAEALEKEFIEQRAITASERITQINELLSAYMLIAQISAAMGDVGMAEQIGERITRLVKSAGPDVATLRTGILNGTQSDPEAQNDAYDDLTSRVNIITAKARGLAALIATAHKVAENKEDSDAPKRIEQAANDLNKALGDPPTLKDMHIEASV